MKRLIALVACLFVPSLASAQLFPSAERQGDAPVYVGAPYSQSESAIAYGGGVGLVAWSDGRGGVYAARVDASNRLLDEGGLRLGLGSRPAIAFDGANFLVVWQNDLGGNGYDIRAARVGPDGTLLDATPILVSDAPNAQIAPSVAYVGGVYLVVWQDARSGGSNYEFVIGARVDPNGTVLDPGGLLICQAAGNRTWPSVAAGTDGFLVVWADGRTASTPQIYGARVTPQGVVEDPNGTALTTATSFTPVGEPAVAFDGTNFWVTYTLLSGSYSGNIRAFRLSPSLQVLDATHLPVTLNSSWNRLPNITCGGGQCLVVWNHDDQSLDMVYGARLRADGTLLTPNNQPHYFGMAPTAITSGNQRRFGVAWDGTAFAATWHERNRLQTTGGRELDIYQRRLALDGSFPDAQALRVSTAANLQVLPSVAFNGTHSLVVWVDDRNDQSDIYGARYDADGNLLDANAIAVSTAPGRQTSPVVAAINGDFLVLWVDERGGSESDLYATRVTGDGVVSSPSGIPVSTTSGNQSDPRLVCGESNCLAVWWDTRNSTNGDIYATRLSPTGAVLDLGGLLVDASSSSVTSPAVAFDGTQYLIAWMDVGRFSDERALFGRRLLPTGAFVDTPALRLVSSYGSSLAAAAMPGQFFVSWVTSSRTVLAARVPGGTPVTLHAVDSTRLIDGQTLASDGQTVLSVWGVEPTSGYTATWPRSLWARQLAANGSLFGPAFQLLDLTPQYEAASPALVAPTARQWLLAYSRKYPSKPLGNVRTALRPLTPAPLGNACTADAQCQSGFCVEGVCCDSVCGGGVDGDCQACSVAKGAATNGTCGPLAQGTLCRASAGVCDAAEVCDGTGPSCPADAPATDGTACDDGNLCTQSDTCQAGACTGSSPVVCSPSDSCHEAGVCDPSTGVCSTPAKANGVACDDGNACTQTDTCQAGTCTGSTPVVCTALDQCHAAGTCNPETGTCSTPNKPDGEACNDGNLCTQSDTCQAGACTGTHPVSCVALDACHEAGVCNPFIGTCSNPAKADGVACDDSNLCTQADTCQAGVCTGGTPVVCTAEDQCHDVGTCNPATGTCSNPSKPNGAACDDGNRCTQTDTCQAGSCQGANPVVCTAQDQCHTAGACEPATGTCPQTPKSDGTACNDGSLCTRVDMCRGGVCAGTEEVTCAAADACHTAGTCNPQSGQCSNPSAPDGTACDDGTLCTRSDSCRSGVCVGADPVVCHSDNECEEASACSEGQCTFSPRPDGTPCTSGTCKAGTCEATPGADAGTPGADGGSDGTPEESPTGCGCGAANGGSAALAALLLAVLGRRRQRR